MMCTVLRGPCRRNGDAASGTGELLCTPVWVGFVTAWPNMQVHPTHDFSLLSQNRTCAASSPGSSLCHRVLLLSPPLLPGLVLPSFPQHTVSVKYATEHRCGVVVRGSGLSDAISGTDPLKDNLPLLTAQPLDDTPEVRGGAGGRGGREEGRQARGGEGRRGEEAERARNGGVATRLCPSLQPGGQQGNGAKGTAMWLTPSSPLPLPSQGVARARCFSYPCSRVTNLRGLYWHTL